MIPDEKQTEKWKSIEEQNQNIGHEWIKLFLLKWSQLWKKLLPLPQYKELVQAQNDRPTSSRGLRSESGILWS